MLKTLILSSYSVFVWLVVISYTAILPGVYDWLALKASYLIILFLSVVFIAAKRPWSVHRLDVWLFLYVVFVLLSSIYNLSMVHAGSAFLSEGVFYLLCFFVVRSTCFEYGIQELVRPVFYALVFVLFLSLLVLVGAPVPLYGLDPEASVSSYASGTGGFLGVFSNPNALGMISASTAVISFLVMGFYSSFFKRLFVFVILLLSSLMVLFSFSRSSILLLAVSFFLYYVVFVSGVKSNFYVFVLALVGFAGFYVVGDYVEGFFHDISERGDSGRAVIWKDAFAVFLENLYWGVGIDEYYFVTDSGAKISTHNVYISQLVSLGVFGFAFWGLVFFVCISRFCADVIRYGAVRSASLAFGLIVGILFHQFFESTINQTLQPLTVILFIAMSISLAPRLVYKELVFYTGVSVSRTVGSRSDVML